MSSRSSSSFRSFIDPMLDGRKEIAKYNRFMDGIFTRMNAAIKAKKLDPMDLRLLPAEMKQDSDYKVPRSDPTFQDSTTAAVKEVRSGPVLQPSRKKAESESTVNKPINR